MTETSKALEAFVIYRDMGPKRSVEAVAATCHKGVSILNRWSQAHGWVERAKAHDELIAQRAAAADIKARAEDQERRRQNRLKISDGEQSIGAVELKRLQDRQKDEKRPLRLSVQDIVRLLDHSDRVQRLDTGEPTERLQGTVDHNVTFSITFDRADEDHNL